ncbi:54S ribosomal protein L2 mitochondrial [Trebouxia sp. C0009 RCD-2024]
MPHIAGFASWHQYLLTWQLDIIVGQKRLTNVAVVRYKKKGKRFEVACYKNKVLNWRNGVEKDIDEVLQATTVFGNVSKGTLAKHEDLVDVFGTGDEEKICRIILAEGDLQVSDKERQLELDSLFKDVASVLSEKCINPDNNKPYTISMLERALKDVHFSVDLHRNAKQQALEALPILQAKFAIKRALMRLQIQVPQSCKAEAIELLAKLEADVETKDFSASQMTITCLVEPGHFRQIHSWVQQSSEGQGRLEVVSLAAIDDTDTSAAFDSATPQHLQSPTTSAAAPDGAAADPTAAKAISNSGFVAPSQALPTRRNAPAQSSSREEANLGEVIYPRGSISGLPEAHASRKERFAELEDLQRGWEVELRGRKGGTTVDAFFFSPTGESVGAFVNARRAALKASKH